MDINDRYHDNDFSPCFESIGALDYFYNMLTQLKSNASVQILDVYEPNAEEQADARLFADNVHDVMGKALNIPSSESSYADKREYHALLRSKM